LTFVSLNSRLESNKEEEEGVKYKYRDPGSAFSGFGIRGFIFFFGVDVLWLIVHGTGYRVPGFGVAGCGPRFMVLGSRFGDSGVRVWGLLLLLLLLLLLYYSQA